MRTAIYTHSVLKGNDSLAWSLGDILSRDSITATLMVQIPDSIPDFIELDSGGPPGAHWRAAPSPPPLPRPP